MLLICYLVICEYNEIQQIAFELKKYYENCRETAAGHHPIIVITQNILTIWRKTLE